MENKPICPECKIEMEIHKCIGGEKWYCENYHLCGQTKEYK